jgi:hypothetical protein
VKGPFGAAEEKSAVPAERGLFEGVPRLAGGPGVIWATGGGPAVPPSSLGLGSAVRNHRGGRRGGALGGGWVANPTPGLTLIL